MPMVNCGGVAGRRPGCDSDGGVQRAGFLHFWDPGDAVLSESRNLLSGFGQHKSRENQAGRG